MYKFINIKTLLLFVPMEFLIMINAASEECPVGEKVCSGDGSKWNTSTNQCDCGEDLWGKHCEFGRRRFTSQSGYIVESHGNYHCSSKYMYLIDSGRPNVSIQIRLNQFATECNWDYLYIFDGRSIYDPLIAAYSGRIKTHNTWLQINNTNLNSVTAKSGAAYLYFYSDALINDIGFHVSYTISNCTNEKCHGNGVCDKSGRCICNEGWTGLNCTKKQCCREVFSLFHGVQTECRICNNHIEVSPRASHAVAVSGAKMWVYGGYSFGKDTGHTNKILLYDLDAQDWISVEDCPERRFGHTMVYYGESLFIFGGNAGSKGRISNEILEYKTTVKTWSKKTPKKTVPIAVTGHASVLIGGAMYTFFGFNKELLYTKYVQKYDLDTQEWEIVKTFGAFVNGRFGHTATYDYLTQIVFVFGGFYYKHPDTKLLLFHVNQSKWTISDALSSPNTLSRMLHVAGIIGRNLVIFGGNEHQSNNANSKSSKCFSSSLLAYNIDYNASLPIPEKNVQILERMERYGHSAVIHNRSMFIFGGFDGTFKNDIFQIRISGDCHRYLLKDDCIGVDAIADCVWNKKDKKCMINTKLLPDSSILRKLNKPKRPNCKQYKECVDCTSHECYWNQGTQGAPCIGEGDNNNILSKKVSDPRKCRYHLQSECTVNSGCVACSSDDGCYWNPRTGSSGSCDHKTFNGPKRTCFVGNVTSCEDVHDCHSCVSVHTRCMWCESRRQCLHSNTYKVSHPYGQCLEWISKTSNEYVSDKLNCKASSCTNRTSCKKCLESAVCGWCADGSGTGLGKCMAGGDDHPKYKTCPADRWNFISCPACQCNGHSKCYNGTGQCIKCYGNVVGKHCDRCQDGYFGHPERNGTCIKCFCNGHFSSCNAAGKCTCNLRGATGDHCEKCEGGYYGNASKGGMCYVNLSQGFIYNPLNVSNCVKAGFRTVPRKRDTQIEFTVERIAGSRNALLNVSLYYEGVGKTTTIKEKYPLGQYFKRFSEKDYEHFPVEIRAIIFGLTEKEYIKVKIIVKNPTQLFNLIYFLIMFLVCFCSLLIILIVLWKIKQRYDIFVHNRQQRHEHAERISRPFRTITIFLHDKISSYQKVPPSLIVCEQFATGNLAIASVIIELPRGCNGYSPTGHSGICIGSTLVTTPQRWTFTQMQQKYGCDRRRRKTTDRAVNV